MPISFYVDLIAWIAIERDASLGFYWPHESGVKCPMGVGQRASLIYPASDTWEDAPKVIFTISFKFKSLKNKQFYFFPLQRDSHHF